MKTWVHQHSAKLAVLGLNEDPITRPAPWESVDFCSENEVNVHSLWQKAAPASVE